MNEEIKKILDDHEQRIKALEVLLSDKETLKLKKKKLSLKEFILLKKPKDYVQKTLAIGYYLEKYDGFTSFNVKNLEKGFRDAKEIVPKNINDKVIKNIAKGHMMETKEKNDKLKTWNLTSSGERFVENGFKEE
ncbi:MAG: hypothetical protein H3Z50_05565 [archaeon]|nr:hypothetical protein [archaeon]MCP8305948.1 hypothetical protein [archaeon]